MALVILHIEGVDPAQFKAIRVQEANLKEEGLYSIQSPYSFKVDGAADSKPMQEWRLYLSKYLLHREIALDHRDYRVKVDFKLWGEHIFKALFEKVIIRYWLFHTSDCWYYASFQLLMNSSELEIQALLWQTAKYPVWRLLSIVEIALVGYT